MAPYTSQLTHAYTFSFLSNTHQYIDSWSSNKRRTPQSLLSLLDNLISFCWQPKSAICYKRTVTAVAHVYVAIHISQFVYIFTYTYRHTTITTNIWIFFISSFLSVKPSRLYAGMASLMNTLQPYTLPSKKRLGWVAVWRFFAMPTPLMCALFCSYVSIHF